MVAMQQKGIQKTLTVKTNCLSSVSLCWLILSLSSSALFKNILQFLSVLPGIHPLPVFMEMSASLFFFPLKKYEAITPLKPQDNAMLNWFGLGFFVVFLKVV